MIVVFLLLRNTKIRATGLGPLNYLYSMALSRIADNAKDEVLPIVETELSNMIQQQIESGLTFSGFETYANWKENPYFILMFFI